VGIEIYKDGQTLRYQNVRICFWRDTEALLRNLDHNAGSEVGIPTITLLLYAVTIAAIGTASAPLSVRLVLSQCLCFFSRQTCCLLHLTIGVPHWHQTILFLSTHDNAWVDICWGCDVSYLLLFVCLNEFLSQASLTSRWLKYEISWSCSYGSSDCHVCVSTLTKKSSGAYMPIALLPPSWRRNIAQSIMHGFDRVT
jgi:hypothetical protein